MLQVKCKVWETFNPAHTWVETFNVHDQQEVKHIFDCWNAQISRPDRERDYEIIEVNKIYFNH